MKAARRGLLAAVVFALSTGHALAWHLSGYVFCDGTGLPLAGVTVNVNGIGSAFTGSATSDANGLYYVPLADAAGDYVATVDLSGVGGGTVLSPAQPMYFSTTDTDVAISINLVVSSPACQNLGCWLTGGGSTWSKIAGLYVAEKTVKINFGGNVNPGCSPTAGQGGQWTHVDKQKSLWFQGTVIVVDDCGNVDGIPPGSTSPATPFNFIEFHGTGTLKGIAGNKTNKTDVCFVARAEDRNEPGSGGTNDGALKDRYFIRVFDCVTSKTLVVLENTQGGSDPTPISAGNLQIHASSCSN
jgi:hypothetical protein